MLIPGLVTTLGQVRAAMQAAPVTLQDLPAELRRDWIAADGRARIEIYPAATRTTTRRSSASIARCERLAPEATGAQVSIQGVRTNSRARVRRSGVLGAVVSIVDCWPSRCGAVLDVLLTLAPLAVVGLATLGICVSRRSCPSTSKTSSRCRSCSDRRRVQHLFRDRVARGRRELLQSSLTRAVIFSALATGTRRSAACGCRTIPGHVEHGTTARDLARLHARFGRCSFFLRFSRSAAAPLMAGIAVRLPGCTADSISRVCRSARCHASRPGKKTTASRSRRAVASASEVVASRPSAAPITI
jgi:hypothetical protein